MQKKNRFLISLFIVSALMSGCAVGTKSDGNRVETTAQAESTETETTSKETTAVDEKTGNVSEASELTFPLGQEIQSDSFTGKAYISQIIPHEDTYNFPQTNHITFEPGVINNWHMHAGGQILIATDGVGYHQIEGEPVQIMHPGDVAFCPPGVKHWHGGSADTSFAHIAVNTNPEQVGVEWFDRISEETYQQLGKE